MRRRTLLKVGGLAAAALAAPLPFVFSRRGKLPSSLHADSASLMDLPPGFQYQVIDQRYSSMSDGYRVPALPDGMACFPGRDGSLVLMRNHEITGPKLLGPCKLGQAIPPEAYDKDTHGGVTRVVVDAKTLKRRSSNLVLTGTQRNCAGGVSPWGWLSCEETTAKNHGFVFLCDPSAERVQPPRRLDAYGRCRHEAACVHPDTLIAYLTEDQGDSCLYRFVPNSKAKPFEGKLQALAIQGRPRFDTSEQMGQGERLKVRWVDLPDPCPVEDTLRRQGRERGAASIRRAEGIWVTDDTVFFCSTTGGPAAAGQIFRLHLGKAGAADELELFVQSTSREQLDCPDNLTMAPWGDVVIAEDGGGDQFLRGITPEGKIYDIARNAASSGELAGVCFAPDGNTLFVNMFLDGLTLAIRGPFRQLGRA